MNEEIKENKYLIGPGLGLIIMGFAYILWWFVGPWAWEAIATDIRWAHNWAYAIIIFNVGLSWYHKSPITRTIAMFQSFLMPITASGSFNTIICTIIATSLLFFWLIFFILEKKRKVLFFSKKLTDRGIRWLNMHTLVLAWILIAHMGLMFFIVRLPIEFSLFQIQNNAGFLANLPPEGLEFATWTYDIGLFIFLLFVIKEQYNLGYNVKNKPWPKKSFYVVLLVMGLSLIALLIQDLTIGFDWINIFYP